jgi:hypothetical protein
VIALVGLLLIAIVGFGVFFYKLNQEYNKHRVIVWKRHVNTEGKEFPIIIDVAERGRIKKDKKLKKWVFHLKNANVFMGEEENFKYDEQRDLDVPTVPYEKGQKVCFVEKLGTKKYAFGEPFMIFGKPVVIVSQADCSEAIRSYDMNVKTYGKKKNELLAFTLYIIFAIAIMVMVIVLITKIEVLTDKGIKVVLDPAITAAKSVAVASSVPG